MARTLRARILARYRSRYADFGPTLAAEYLRREDGLKVDHETLRGALARWRKVSGGRGGGGKSIGSGGSAKCVP